MLEALPPYLIPLLVATFLGAVVSGMCGFAFGLVASAIWLHFIPPAQSVPLIAAFVIVIQAWSVWKLRRAVVPGRVLPLLAGGVIGIPFGVAALRWLSAAEIQLLTGVVTIAFGVYGLAMPKTQHRYRGVLPDMLVGVTSGLLGGSTGLAGLPTTAWTSLRDWPKHEQRAVFQPVTFILFIVMLAWLGGTGAVTAETVGLFVIGLPPLALGTWLGWRLYGRFDDETFRKAILVMLLLSGCLLAYGGN